MGQYESNKVIKTLRSLISLFHRSIIPPFQKCCIGFASRAALTFDKQAEVSTHLNLTSCSLDFLARPGAAAVYLHR